MFSEELTKLAANSPSEALQSLTEAFSEQKGLQKRSDVMDMLNSNPMRFGLLGAGLGGLYGGLLSKQRKDESRWNKILTGALSGGAIVGGLGLLHQGLTNVGDGTPGEQPGIEFIHNDKQYRLDPTALETHPKLLEHIQKTQDKSLFGSLTGRLGNFITGYASNHPLLATIGAADIGTQALGTAADMANPLHKPLGETGRAMSGRPEHLGVGIDKMLDEPKLDAGLATALESLKEQEPIWRRVIREAREGKKEIEIPKINTPAISGGQVTVNSATPGIADTLKSELNKRPYFIKPENIVEAVRHGSGVVRRGGPVALRDLISRFIGDTDRRNQFIEGSDKWMNNSRIGRTLKTLETVRNPLIGKVPTWLARLGPRAALYAGVPAAEAYIRSISEDAVRERELQELATRIGR